MNTKKAIWISDPHFEFTDSGVLTQFLDDLRGLRPDEVWISGDISVPHRRDRHLTLLHESLACPIRFVLGNHDFYGCSIAEGDAATDALCARLPRLQHLGKGEVVELGTRAALVGHRGWADGRAGNGPRSKVMLNDYIHIRDFADLDRPARFARLAELGDESAAHLRRAVVEAMDLYDEVFLLTHVPPFAEATWHEGKPSSPEFLPHFCNKAGGRAILEAAAEHPERNLTVLCGHCHSGGTVKVATNVTVITAEAEYGKPAIARIFEFEQA